MSGLSTVALPDGLLAGRAKVYFSDSDDASVDDHDSYFAASPLISDQDVPSYSRAFTRTEPVMSRLFMEPVIVGGAGNHQWSVSTTVVRGLAAEPYSRSSGRNRLVVHNSATSWAMRIVSELGRLKEGWAGEGSAAPKSSIGRDILTVYPQIDARNPDVEIDDETGNVSFRWFGRDALSAVTMNFIGEGKIVVTYTRVSVEGSKFEEFNSAQLQAISAYFMEDDIAEITK
ncbi:hypothetical protein [Hoeflea sp. EC-HK425]|uniref:hypothetical protein n=1 Tax=Hoeflea sp. EC-HK425 TaxID=2038388 RepID=UPI00125821AC|nr:hypothetical protein [Hoeflea sp. EC-HK425]VVT14839.1 hypothetical protein HOE425_331164 [Hoeflea sp. EC-HK425]